LTLGCTKTMATVAGLQQDYERLQAKAERLRAALSTEVAHLLNTNEVTLGVPIESRVKTWDSIQEKLVRKSLTLSTLTELNDLVGIRLILLFQRDVQTAHRLVAKTLRVLSAEDTGKRLGDARFGYSSLHMVVTTPDSWRSLPTYADLGGIQIELQIRTLAQHIWAAASHKLQYKHEASVPAQLRRSINRASALLETIDLEFDRLLVERDTYLRETLPVESGKDALNVETLRAVLDVTNHTTNSCVTSLISESIARPSFAQCSPNIWTQSWHPTPRMPNPSSTISATWALRARVFERNSAKRRLLTS
jgi:putative GTP pyrophosphokinase